MRVWVKQVILAALEDFDFSENSTALCPPAARARKARQATDEIGEDRERFVRSLGGVDWRRNLVLNALAVLRLTSNESEERHPSRHRKCVAASERQMRIAEMENRLRARAWQHRTRLALVRAALCPARVEP